MRIQCKTSLRESWEEPGVTSCLMSGTVEHVVEAKRHGDGLSAGVEEAVCEVRKPARVKSSWGDPLAAFLVLIATYGAATVEATAVLQEPGAMQGAIEMHASLEFDIPVELLGTVQLQTAATANGQSACTPSCSCGRDRAPAVQCCGGFSWRAG